MAGGSNPQNVQVAGQPGQSMAPSPAAGGNIFQQSSNAFTQALRGTSAAGAYQPANVFAGRVGTRFGYNPQNVQASSVGTQFGYTPQSVQAGSPAGGINTYMNPYTQQVIDTSMADLERQRLMQQNQLGAQASAAGAFGGSRQGIAEAETNRAFAQQGGQLAAQLRQQGFQTALGASQQDVANQMQAALANQGAQAQAAQFGQQTGLQAQGMNQQAGMQAALANQAARAQAAQFGQQTGLQAQGMNQQAAMQAALANQSAGLQAANLGLSSANQLGNLSQQGLSMGQSISDRQAQQGAIQQALNQALIDASKAQYGGFTGSPTAGLNTLYGGLGASNMGQQTQTTTQKRGLFDYITALAGIYPS